MCVACGGLGDGCCPLGVGSNLNAEGCEDDLECRDDKCKEEGG